MSQPLPPAPDSPVEIVVDRLVRLRHWLDEVALSQHRDPVAFFCTVQRAGFWRCAWPHRLGLVAICLGGIGVVAALAAPTTRPWAIVTPLLLIFGLTGIFGLITIPTGTLTSATVWLSFWYLYGFSAPFLCLLLLSALAATSGPAFVLSLLIGLPLFLAFITVDTAALLVHLTAARAEKRLAQFRLGGPVPHRLEISRQMLVFWLRLIVAALLFLTALALLLVNGQVSWQGSLFLAVTAAALARGEASMLALAGLPLAWFDGEKGRWRATYSGRNALFLSASTVTRALRRSGLPARQASILLALLVEGAAGPCIAPGIARLDDREIEAILLHLSLRPGGADALYLLARHLSPAQTRLADVYARLAEEAAHPPNLQGWLRLLRSLTDLGEEKMPAGVMGVLWQTRVALVASTYSPHMDRAHSALQPFVSDLAGEATGEMDDPWDVAIWPRALLVHLQAHQAALTQRRVHLQKGDRL